MQAGAWTAFLKRVPLELHDVLMLMTTIGMEISVQNVVCVEEDHVVIRGRLAGTTDMGRVFVIPYDQINYVGFQKAMNEAQIRALFGDNCLLPAQVSGEGVVAVEPAGEAAPTSSGPEPALVPTGAPTQPGEPTASETRLPIPAKAALLERLRARSRAAAQTNPAPPT
jgi:hypothetical protein